jgi:hypothetical protein
MLTHLPGIAKAKYVPSGLYTKIFAGLSGPERESHDGEGGVSAATFIL